MQRLPNSVNTVKTRIDLLFLSYTFLCLGWFIKTKYLLYYKKFCLNCDLSDCKFCSVNDRYKMSAAIRSWGTCQRQFGFKLLCNPLLRYSPPLCSSFGGLLPNPFKSTYCKTFKWPLEYTCDHIVRCSQSKCCNHLMLPFVVLPSSLNVVYLNVFVLLTFNCFSLHNNVQFISRTW